MATLITATGDALNKAHVKYLESRLVEAALQAGAMRLENGNAPPRPSLNEAALSNMEGFLDILHMVLPAIRVDLFQTGRRATRAVEKTAAATANDEVAFTLSLPRHAITANALLVAGEMVVQAGSEVRPTWVGDLSNKTRSASAGASLASSTPICLRAAS